MQRLKPLKIAATLIAFAASSNALAGEIIVAGGAKLKSYSEISDYFYGLYGSHMSNAITSRTLSKLDLTQLEGKFAFVSPSRDTFRERYMWVGGFIKPDKETQLMIAYSEQLRCEMIFYYFEKMGLVESIDVIDSSSLNSSFEKNYDYIVSMNSEFNGKRDAKSANARKTDFVVRNLKTGKEQKFAETVASPVLVDLFETVAVKFSDAVAATN